MTDLIKTAVEPLRTLAIQAAAEVAQNMIARMVAEMETAGWDVNKAAPRPNSRTDDRNTYLAKKAKHERFTSVFKYVQPVNPYVPHPPTIYTRDAARETQLIESFKAQANASFDAYVSKLVFKVGEVTAAEITEGRYVWGYSVLSVTKPDGSKENWKTQQIVNVSSLGKLFNQWPTRKVK
jgi:hypothetical protein